MTIFNLWRITEGLRFFNPQNEQELDIRIHTKFRYTEKSIRTINNDQTSPSISLSFWIETPYPDYLVSNSENITVL